MTRTILTAVVAVVFSVGPVATASAQTKAEAKAMINTLQGSIANATQQISDHDGYIFAANGAIVLAEVALKQAQQKQPPNQGDIFALQIALGLAKATKNDLVLKQQNWERFRRDQQKALAQWEEYLRQLGH